MPQQNSELIGAEKEQLNRNECVVKRERADEMIDPLAKNEGGFGPSYIDDMFPCKGRSKVKATVLKSTSRD